MPSASRLSTLAKYPFLPEARKYISEYGLTLESFSDPAYSKIVERAKQRIVDAVRLGERVDPSNMSEDEVVELASFPLAIILVAAVKDRFLARRFALAEASLATKLLSEDAKDAKRGSKTVLRIARDVFGMDVEVTGNEYSMALRDYLKASMRFNAPSWKLVNRIVDRGRVMVTISELIRLLKDRVVEYVLENVEKAMARPPKLPENLQRIVDEIKSILPSKRYEEEIISGESSPEAWPPCMKLIYQEIMRGENVSHFANFALASFLINIGMSLDNILKIFAHRPDFNQRIARYQIEHIAGLRGSRTKYTTPSCDTMRTNGLCVEDGKLCGGVKNPLVYFRRSLRRLRKADKNKAEVEGERG
ncbi:MAG: DNA primase large subunit PriL [Thaumarchaeota archaeon]|nr:DNA primase large subunit PriL [Nitrososphaerota archaeon]